MGIRVCNCVAVVAIPPLSTRRYHCVPLLEQRGGCLIFSTACVHFASDLVDQSKVYISDGYSGIVGAGTDGGGAAEVYANVDDANKRNDYLSVFDGTILTSGSHDVVGTCVVRTSHLLTASQQKALEGEIADSLTKLE